MKYLFFCLLILGFSFQSFAQKQKVNVKKDIVSVDKVPAFKIEYNLIASNFTVKNLNDEKLIFIQMEVYHDRSAMNAGNPNGNIHYYEFTFFNEAMDKCETPQLGLKKNVAKEIVKNDLIKDGQLNEIAVKQYVRIYGTKYSERRNSSTTIIINNN